MSGKGVMIELHVDPGRLTSLAPLHEETPLADTEPLAALAAAATGPCHEAALLARQQLLALTGTELPLLEETEFRLAEHLPGPMLALGHGGNNELLRRLHYLGYLEERLYPATREGAYRVLSVHNPFGDGHNVVAVLGRTAAEVTAGVSALLARLEAREGRWLLPEAVNLVSPLPPTPDREELLRALVDLRPGVTGHPRGVIAALEHLRATGEWCWARAFIDLVRPYASGEIPLSFWLMSAVDFWTDRLVLGWDAVEELPYFTGEERLLVLNFLLACTQYCYDSLTYQKWRQTAEEHMVFNHHTFPATGLFFGSLYLQRHGYELPELRGWLEKSLRVFARAATAGRSFDEGGAGYSWLVGNHLLRVSMAAGDYSYARSEKLRHYADLAAVIQNNHFELVPYGDCGAYHATGTGAAGILLRAAEWHQEPGYKWLAAQHAPEAAAADVFTADLPAAPPDAHVGLFVLPLDPVVWRWTTLPTFPGYPPPALPPNVPAAQAFDKLSLRGGWQATDDYLLLQGFGAGQHGHPDANAISQYQARGRTFLVDNDYIRRMPEQHNMVLVIRDGEQAPIPPVARLEDTCRFPGGAYTCSSLGGYNGCDWRRALLWLRNDCVLVIDTLQARVAGDYELRCYWRTLAETELTATGLHTVHDGEHFHVVEASQSERRLHCEPLPLNQTHYPEYRYGDGRPQVLSLARRAHLAVGESVTFASLLLPNGGQEEPRRTLCLLPDNRLLLSGEGPRATISDRGFQVDGAGSYAFSEETRLALATARAEAPPAGSAARRPTTPGAEVAWEVALAAPAACLAPLPEGGVLVGGSDGTIARVSPAGELVTLGQAADRVGAVLAGCLYGEPRVSYLAAAHDCTLRCFSAGGVERFRVELPRNSHMPAWGKALCLADLDGEGRLWPVVGTAAWRVHAVAPDGSLRWTFDTAAHAVTCLAAGDLNGDGRDEVAAGTVYFCVPAITADGHRLWEDEDYNDYWTAGPDFPHLHILDVDRDGDLEVVTAGCDTLVHCLDCRGVKKWTRSIGDAPAGLRPAGAGVAAASVAGEVHLLDGAGQRLWRTPLGARCRTLATTGAGAEGLLCAGLEDGGVVWLRLDGQVAAESRLGGPLTALTEAGGVLVAATEDGKLRALRPRCP